MKKLGLNIFLAFLILLGNMSCDKWKPKQESTWKIDGKTYTTNKISVSLAENMCIVSPENLNDRFLLTFYCYKRFPTSSNFLLVRDNSNNDGRLAVLSIFYNGKYYGIDNDTTLLYASRTKNKARYRLDPTWYSHYENGVKDAILVEANINEP